MVCMHIYMCICMCDLMCLCANEHMCTCEWKPEADIVVFGCSSPYILRQGLSLNLELTVG